MQRGVRSSLFGIIVRCKAPAALAVGKQLCDFAFLGRQIQAAWMFVHDECIQLFPDHRPYGCKSHPTRCDPTPTSRHGCRGVEVSLSCSPNRRSCYSAAPHGDYEFG